MSGIAIPLIVVVGAKIALSSAALNHKITNATNNGMYPIIDPGNTTISIHILTLNEEVLVESTLQTIVEQPMFQEYHPSNIELVLVDSNSEDNTVDIAANYVDRVISTPRGKLTARRIGIEQSDADIIVSTDSGTYYPDGWLNLLLRHFEDEDVVAVGGTTLPVPGSVGTLFNVGLWWYNRLFLKLLGRNSAFRRDAFFETGGWDETIDQTNVYEMVKEEEIDFRKKMKEVGTVVRDLEAVCYEDYRRYRCGSDPEIGEYCEMIKGGGRF